MVAYDIWYTAKSRNAAHHSLQIYHHYRVLTKITVTTTSIVLKTKQQILQLKLQRYNEYKK